MFKKSLQIIKYFSGKFSIHRMYTIYIVNYMRRGCPTYALGPGSCPQDDLCDPRANVHRSYYSNCHVSMIHIIYLPNHPTLKVLSVSVWLFPKFYILFSKTSKKISATFDHLHGLHKFEFNCWRTEVCYTYIIHYRTMDY